MKSQELLQKFRALVRDTVPDYLWSDAEAYGYMTKAQQQYAIETGGIADATSVVTVLTITTGDTFIPYDDRILKIREARRAIDGKRVGIINNSDLDPDMLDSTPGAAKHLVVGMDAGNFRLIPEADADETITLTVFRLPLVDIVGIDQDLEVPAHRQEQLVYWMAFLAHQKMDAETFDKGKQSDFFALWNNFTQQVNREKANREHSKRTVTFNGGL